MEIPAAWRLALGVVLVFAVALVARRAEPPVLEVTTWSVVASDLPSALMSVDGTSSEDVYFAGADKGTGPLVVHYDGERWARLSTGVRGDLWWVHAFSDGPVFFGGAGGLLLRYDRSTFERLPVPGLARQTVYGVWGSSPTDVYAVGGAAGREGFIWHYDGQAVTSIDLPLDVPRLANGEVPGLFKVWGVNDDLWVVGGAGAMLHKHGDGPFTVMPSGTREMLFTVHGSARDVVAVGGSSNGVAVRSERGADFVDASPSFAGLLQGIYESTGGRVWASGEKGLVYLLTDGRFEPVDTGLAVAVGSLHSVYVDDIGGVWSVGGNVLSASLDGGAAIHRGAAVPQLDVVSVVAPPIDAGEPNAVCPAAVVEAGVGRSIARRWDEQALASIRRDLPRPTVHARNLFHLSVAMWDAWAAFDPAARGMVVLEKQTASDVGSSRTEAISYAAYRILVDRYHGAIGADVDLDCYRAVMRALGYDPDDTNSAGDTARALGNRIGEAIITRGASDGANQSADYADPSPYAPVNVPLVVDDPGAELVDPAVWQPLNLAVAATQNGIILPSGVQGYIGSQWGVVTPFVKHHFDVGPAPMYRDASMPSALGEVIARSSELDPNDPTTIDTSPGAYGNNSLGANDGAGRPLNPITHEPYAPQVVLKADFGRALAEFWADGPESETPPGHWNVIANFVADSKDFARRLHGLGTPLDPLSWDIHVYLALNGALHDAAIAAWGEKRISTSARPISLIRWMAKNDMLPAVLGLIEPITDASSAPGERHAHLAHYKGQMAIRAWRGEPSDREKQASGVGWIRAADWMPYQRRTFVTPAFPGFISGHSTFSRAAAEVLTELTGSPYFPGGLGEYVLPRNAWLTFERGPTTDVHLQWSSFYDAADQAGQSRVWGGIHISADDFAGRKVGSAVGVAAVKEAEKYWVDTGK
jgi:hypothetical protein